MKYIKKCNKSIEPETLACRMSALEFKNQYNVD
jgi:hypothetical protein